MVGPRYRLVDCRQGNGVLQEYAGGCVISSEDLLDEFFNTDGRCDCPLGECKKEAEDGQGS